MNWQKKANLRFTQALKLRSRRWWMCKNKVRSSIRHRNFNCKIVDGQRLKTVSLPYPTLKLNLCASLENHFHLQAIQFLDAHVDQTSSRAFHEHALWSSLILSMAYFTTLPTFINYKLTSLLCSPRKKISHYVYLRPKLLKKRAKEHD